MLHARDRLKKHLVAGRLDLAAKDVADGALELFQEPVTTVAEHKLVRRALVPVWEAAAGQQTQHRRLGITQPEVVRAQWDWLLEQGVPSLKPQEGLGLVASWLSHESPAISAADWLIERGMLDLHQIQATPALLVSAVQQSGPQAMTWLLNKGAPADPEPTVSGPHHPPPLLAAVMAWTGDTDDKVRRLLDAGARADRPGSFAAGAVLEAPLVVLARTTAGRHHAGTSVDWTRFATVWDRLVAAGADPLAPDATGISARQWLVDTPGEAMWVARQREEQSRHQELPARRQRARA